MQKTAFVDLNLYCAEDIGDRHALLQSRSANINYTFYLPEDIEVVMVHLAGFNDEFKTHNVQFEVRKQRNSRLNTFFFLFLKIRKKRPKVILLHGFLHPLHIILCKLILGRNAKIILQNHGEKPYRKVRLVFQRWADKCISRYLFVDKAQAKMWIDKKVIANERKVYEVMEGSTTFSYKDKTAAKIQLGYSSEDLFIWVGRLDSNKDPLTVLRAFAEHVKKNVKAKLVMIYGTRELESEIEDFIRSCNISSYVELRGEIKHSLLEEYYLAADYFILGSHHEGSGYALCEAMSCGCVPIVTAIPSFVKMTNNGQCAYLFEPGNVDALKSVLTNLKPENLSKMKQLVIEQFENELSFKAIARKFSRLIVDLGAK